MHSLSTGNLSSLYSLPTCMVFERVRSIKKESGEGKHFRMVTGRNGIVFFCFLFRDGKVLLGLLKNDSRRRGGMRLENSNELTDGNGFGGRSVGLCPMEGQILKLNSLERGQGSQ